MKAKKKYEGGGVFPPAIKKLKERAAKKKAEKAKPSYRGKLDEVTVTAKAPTEAEKRGAKAFIEDDRRGKEYAYATAASQSGRGFAKDEDVKKGKELKKDTAKRLGVSQESTYGDFLRIKKRKKDWKEALKKAGYKK